MRIWFNRGFSLAPVSAAMRASDPDLEVFVSIGKGQPQYLGPTETWIEPEVDVHAYIDWVRDIIRVHAIDIFIPTHHREWIAAAGDLGCRVETPAAMPTIALLEDKFAFANELAGEPFHLATQAIVSSHALTTELERFNAQHPEPAMPCVKPRHGVNGLGFWKLSATTNPMAHLTNPETRTIRSDIYIHALAAQESGGAIDALVLMEYLPGPEVSFDILAHSGELLKYAARTKVGGNRQRIETAHPLAESVAWLVRRFRLTGIVNAQFRRSNNGEWKLLEINARPAGGIVYSEKVGCGLIADWAGILTGRVTPEEVTPRAMRTDIMLSTAVQEVSFIQEEA